jgi:hypothetical protein
MESVGEMRCDAMLIYRGRRVGWEIEAVDKFKQELDSPSPSRCGAPS